MGAGEAARLLLAGLQDQGWSVLALLDDDPAKQGARIGGVSVAGTFEDVTRPDIVDTATHIVTAMPGSTRAQRRRAIELASATHLPVLTVPSIGELRDGGTRIERLRAIEPGRPARPRPGRARRERRGGTDRRQDGARHRCRRQHRQRALPADSPAPAGPPGAVRAERAQPVHGSTRRSPSAFPISP
jgi:hypothetical protein